MGKLNDFLNEKQYNELGSIVYDIEKHNPFCIGKRINQGHIKWVGNIQIKLNELHNDLFLIRKELKQQSSQ